MTWVTMALSIRQPWAWLIVNGFKDIENRNWLTNYRGLFGVHASKTIDHDGLKWALETMRQFNLHDVDFETGGIVGVAEIVDVVTERELGGFWFDGPFGFVLCNQRTVPFIPMPGKLGFFKLGDDAQARIGWF